VQKKITRKKEEVKEFKVNKEIGLLDFLLEKLTDKSRNNVKSLLSHKMISVDGNVISQFDFQLSKGDVVSIGKTPMKQKAQAKKSKLNIIYEDDDFIAINKPSGLLSIATEKEREFTAYHHLMDYIRAGNLKNRVYVVHRIDKDTSGVLIVVKNSKLKDKLQLRWNELVSERKYIAIVEGTLKKKEGTIRTWLKEGHNTTMYSSHIKDDGQEAITNYKVLKENGKYSMLEVKIDTGRKNQIRVHMMEMGHPVVGDEKYLSKTDPLKRLGLHNNVLELRHPFTGKVFRFVAPVPPTFKDLFKDEQKKKAIKK